MSYNPEAGLPVHPDNDWHLPEFIGQMWFAGRIHDALRNLGYRPLNYDDSRMESCRCQSVVVPGEDGRPSMIDPADCLFCKGAGVLPFHLRRSSRWVKDGAGALIVANDPKQIVSPYLAACVAAAMGQ